MSNDQFIQSAIILGEYSLISEWDMIQVYYTSMTEDAFLDWIKTHQYYHALVCSTKGNPNEIAYQLQADYKELNEQIALDHEDNED